MSTLHNNRTIITRVDANPVSTEHNNYPTTIWAYGILRGTRRSTDTIRMRQFFVSINSYTEFNATHVLNDIQRQFQQLEDANGEWYSLDPVYTVRPLLAEEAQALVSPAVTKKQSVIANGIRNNKISLKQLFSSATRDAISAALKAKRRKPKKMRVAEHNSVITEFGGGVSIDNCGVALLGQSRHRIYELKPKLMDADYLSLEQLEDLANELRIRLRLVAPDGQELVRTDAKDNSYNRVYGLVCNSHIYPLELPDYNTIRKSGKVDMKTGEHVYVDTPNLLPNILKRYSEENKLPVFVKTIGGNRVISYRDGDKVFSALENYKRYQKVIELLGLPDKTVPSAPVIAKELINQCGIQREDPYDGPFMHTMLQNNLTPAYHMCECATCADTPADEFVVFDISACYWNILRSMETLPIATPFDTVREGNGWKKLSQGKQTQTFFIIQDFDRVLSIDYNNQWLSYNLVQELDAWSFVKYYLTPSGVINGNIFRTIDGLLSSKLGEKYADEHKLIRNSMTGVLGQMRISTDTQFMTADESLALHTDSPHTLIDISAFTQDMEDAPEDLGNIYVHKRKSCEQYLIPHNRTIYNAIISEGHVQVLRLAKKLLKKYGGHVHKVKVDSVAICLEPKGKEIPQVERDLFGDDSDIDEELDANEEPLSDEEAPLYRDFFAPFTPENPIPDTAVEFDDFTVHMEEGYEKKPCLNRQAGTKKFCPDSQLPLLLRKSISKDEFMRKKKSEDLQWLALIAPARLGKTWFVNHLGLDDSTTMYATSTNVSLSKLRKPIKSTVQGLIAYRIKIPDNIKTLVIDEVSFVGFQVLIRIMKYCKDKGVRLIVSGDYNQLNSIEPGLRCDLSALFAHEFLFVEFGWHRLAAISKEKYDLMESFKNGETTIEELAAHSEEPNPNDVIIRLNYYVKVADKDNISVPDDERIFYKTTDYFKEHPDRGIPNGLKLIRKVEVVGGDSAEAEPSTTASYFDWEDGTPVDIQNERKEVALLHASTVHSFQGSDVNNAFNIPVFLFIDCKGFSREMMYTAITRTPGFRFKLINVNKYKGYSVYSRLIEYKPSYVVYEYRDVDLQGADDDMASLTGPLLYVGIAKDLNTRHAQHQKEDAWCTALLYPTELYKCYSEKQARDLEAALIKQEQPKHNKQNKQELKKDKKPPLKASVVKMKKLKRVARKNDKFTKAQLMSYLNVSPTKVRISRKSPVGKHKDFKRKKDETLEESQERVVEWMLKELAAESESE